MSLHRIGNKLYLNPPGAAGKTVEIARSYHEQAERLANAAVAGDFYAITAINHLRALTTGFAGKHNVFISDSGSFRANTYQEVQIYVPNIVATVERREDDKLLINKIELSDEFGKIEAAAQEKPGLYSVCRNNKRVQTRYIETGKINSTDTKPVFVVDPRFVNPDQAGEYVMNKRLEALMGREGFRKGRFYMFFSPLGDTLNGRKNFNANIVNKTYAFAGLLADVIEARKEQTDITWASERAGSIVLTQALTVLADKGLKYDKNKNEQFVTMFAAKSDPRLAYDVTVRLGMSPDPELLNSKGTWETIVNTPTNVKRLLTPSDSYGLTHMAKDIEAAGGNASTIVGASSFVLGMTAYSTGAFWLGAAGTAVSVGLFATKAFKNYMDGR